MIPFFGKMALMPTIVTLVALLPQFQRRFAKTTIPRSLELVSASNEETLDKARSYLMEGVHLLNDVSTRTKAHTELLASPKLKFEEAGAGTTSQGS